jgi:hypothetical protein
MTTVLSDAQVDDETRRSRLDDGRVFVDARCTGTTLRDFVRASDLERLHEDLAPEYQTQAMAVTG